MSEQIIQIGDSVKMLVSPMLKGEVVGMRDGEFECEITVLPFNGGTEVIIGATNLAKVREWSI